MTCRPLQLDSDYRTVETWWTAHKWPVIPAPALPSTGVMVEDMQGNPVVAGWLYLTDSSIAWLEWIVSDPNSSKTVRSECLDLLITTLLGKAKALGFTSVFTSSNHPALIERYKSLGFTSTDTNVTHLLRTI